MKQQRTAVIGGTGQVGRHAVSALDRAGVMVRAIARNPDRASFPTGVEAVRADVRDQEALAAALDGIDSAFLIFPTLQADDHAPSVVRTLTDAVEHVVYLSAEGVGVDVIEDRGILGSHARVERLIRDSGMRWTFLQSGGMATNTLAWARDIAASGVVRWPYADAARSLIHEADLGECAAHVLTTPGHEGQTYVLTGPEVLTHREQASAIGNAIGRPVRYEEMQRDAMREQIVTQWGMEAETADAVLDAWAALVGNTGGVTDAVERLLGRPARSFERWAKDHAADFQPPNPA